MGLVVLALAVDGIIVVVASESCCCVRMDVKRISIFLDFNIYHDIIKNLFRKVSLILNIFFVVKYITCLTIVILSLLL